MFAFCSPLQYWDAEIAGLVGDNSNGGNSATTNGITDESEEDADDVSQQREEEDSAVNERIARLARRKEVRARVSQLSPLHNL